MITSFSTTATMRSNNFALDLVVNRNVSDTAIKKSAEKNLSCLILKLFIVKNTHHLWHHNHECHVQVIHQSVILFGPIPLIQAEAL